VSFLQCALIFPVAGWQGPQEVQHPLSYNVQSW